MVVGPPPVVVLLGLLLTSPSNACSIRRRLGRWQRLSLLSRTCARLGTWPQETRTNPAGAGLAVADRYGAHDQPIKSGAQVVRVPGLHRGAYAQFRCLPEATCLILGSHRPKQARRTVGINVVLAARPDLRRLTWER
jgi:hypothetical protein